MGAKYIPTLLIICAVAQFCVAVNVEIEVQPTASPYLRHLRACDATCISVDCKAIFSTVYPACVTAPPPVPDACKTASSLYSGVCATAPTVTSTCVCTTLPVGKSSAIHDVINPSQVNELPAMEITSAIQSSESF